MAAAQSVETDGSGICQANMFTYTLGIEAKLNVTAKKHSCNRGLRSISTPVRTAQVGLVYHYDVDATNTDDAP
jgi:hypothetical protein